MPLPTSRNTTYVAGTSEVKAADLNALQDYVLDLFTRGALNLKFLGWRLEAWGFTFGKSGVSLSAQDATNLSGWWKPDGLSYYRIGGGQVIYQYTASVAWDPATLVYASKSLSCASVINNDSEGLQFSPDGTKVYVGDGDTNSRIHQWTLTVAWDVAGGNTYNGLRNLVTATSGAIAGSGIRGFAISQDGTKMLVLNYTDLRIYEFTLTTPHDVLTATYDSRSFLTAEDTLPVAGGCLAMSDDGRRVVMLGGTNDNVYLYTLTTPYNVSTMSYSTVNRDIDAVAGTSPTGLCFSADGTKMYITDTSEVVHMWFTSQAVRF